MKNIFFKLCCFPMLCLVIDNGQASYRNLFSFEMRNYFTSVWKHNLNQPHLFIFALFFPSIILRASVQFKLYGSDMVFFAVDSLNKNCFIQGQGEDFHNYLNCCNCWLKIRKGDVIIQELDSMRNHNLFFFYY